MSDIMAAIGLEQIKRFPKMAKIRQRLANQYDELLLGHSTIRPLKRDYAAVVPHIYAVHLSKSIDRSIVQKKLLEKIWLVQAFQQYPLIKKN